MSIYIVGSTFQRHDTRYLRQLSVHNLTGLGRRHFFPHTRWRKSR